MKIIRYTALIVETRGVVKSVHWDSERSLLSSIVQYGDLVGVILSVYP